MQGLNVASEGEKIAFKGIVHPIHSFAYPHVNCMMSPFLL